MNDATAFLEDHDLKRLTGRHQNRDRSMASL
jgi:hypothetical protein